MHSDGAGRWPDFTQSFSDGLGNQQGFHTSCCDSFMTEYNVWCCSASAVPLSSVLLCCCIHFYTRVQRLKLFCVCRSFVLHTAVFLQLYDRLQRLKLFCICRSFVLRTAVFLHTFFFMPEYSVWSCSASAVPLSSVLQCSYVYFYARVQRLKLFCICRSFVLRTAVFIHTFLWPSTTFEAVLHLLFLCPLPPPPCKGTLTQTVTIMSSFTIEMEPCSRPPWPPTDCLDSTSLPHVKKTRRGRRDYAMWHWRCLISSFKEAYVCRLTVMNMLKPRKTD